MGLIKQKKSRSDDIFIEKHKRILKATLGAKYKELKDVCIAMPDKSGQTLLQGGIIILTQILNLGKLSRGHGIFGRPIRTGSTGRAEVDQEGGCIHRDEDPIREMKNENLCIFLTSIGSIPVLP